MTKSEPRNRRKKKQGSGNEDIISMTNVTKSYATGAPALNGIDLHIKPGEFVFIVGDSGSGKSTMIKLLLRELVPTSGEISVMGYDLLKIRHRKIPKFRRNLGIVFQDFRLLKDRNVYENVAFAQRIVQTPGKEIKRNVPSILATVGLAGKYKAKPRQLSGGEQQRVVIARALVNLLEQINENGTTVLVVTHNREIVNAMQKRVVTMKKGIIVSDEEKGVYIDED